MSHIITGREQSGASKYELGSVVVNKIRKPRRLCVGSDLLNTITPDQMGKIYELSGHQGFNAERDIKLRVGCSIDQVSIAFADLYIKELRGRAWMAVTETEGVM